MRKDEEPLHLAGTQLNEALASKKCDNNSGTSENNHA